MGHYHYLIAGGGMAADSAVRGIRELDPNGSIGLVSKEANPPYDRPPLSKDLWKGKPIEEIWRHTAERGVDMILDCSVRAIDPANKRVTIEDGTEHAYDKLLLATGGRPLKLPFGDGDVLYYRSLQDYQRLRQLAEEKDHFAVIGGGFIGSELAAALARNGKRVTYIISGESIGRHVFPADLGHFLNAYYEVNGVELVTRSSVTAIQRQGRHFRVKTRNAKDGSEREIRVDQVVAGVGIQPNLELARAAGLETDAGIAVNAYLRTNDPDIYAAGDAAAFYQPVLGRRTRFEHADNADAMGRTAGRNMAGAEERYSHLPFFYSDLFDLGYEAVGDLDTGMEMETDWKELYRRGTIYYKRAGRVRGVLLWNVWGQIDAARRLLTEQAN